MIRLLCGIIVKEVVMRVARCKSEWCCVGNVFVLYSWLREWW